MPSIPTFVPQRSQPGNLRAPEGLGQEVPRALIGLGQDISSVGGQLSRMSQTESEKIRSVQDTTTMAKINAIQDSTITDFDLYTDSNPDVTKWQGQMETIRQNKEPEISALASKLSPDARKHYEAQDFVFRKKLDAHFRVSQQRQVVKDGLGVLEAQITSAVTNQDIPALEQGIEHAKSTGLISPKIAEVRLQENKTRITVNRALDIINNDPFRQGGVKEFEGKVPEDRFRVLERQLMTKQNDERSRFMHELDRMRSDDPTKMPGRDEKLGLFGGKSINQMASEMGIDQRSIDARYRVPGTPTYNLDEIKQLETSIITTTSEAMTVERAADLRWKVYQMPLPATEQARLLKAIDDQKSVKSEANSFELRSVYSIAHQEYSSGMFLPWTQTTKRGGLFSTWNPMMGFKTVEPGSLVPPWETEAGREKMPKWRLDFSKAEVDAADRMYAHVVTGLREWFISETEKRGGKPPTMEETQQMYTQLKRPYLVDNINRAIEAVNATAHPVADGTVVSKGGYDYRYSAESNTYKKIGPTKKP